MYFKITIMYKSGSSSLVYGRDKLKLNIIPFRTKYLSSKRVRNKILLCPMFLTPVAA